jgi:hypothetical protein
VDRLGLDVLDAAHRLVLVQEVDGAVQASEDGSDRDLVARALELIAIA